MYTRSYCNKNILLLQEYILYRSEKRLFTEYFLMVFRVLLEYTIITEYSVKVLGSELYRVLGSVPSYTEYSVKVFGTEYILSDNYMYY